MDLTTSYLGLSLETPLIAAAGPLTKDLDSLRRMEDAGLSAVVLPSLFEEELLRDSKALDRFLTEGSESFSEALSYFPVMDDGDRAPEEYLEHLRKAKEVLSVPVIASLNGVSKGGWIDFARNLEEAGADALELNIYYVPTDPNLSGEAVEGMYVDDVAAVKSIVKVPVAVKVSPFFTNMAHFAKGLDGAGADGLVLFNRFLQPDLDLDTLEVKAGLTLSSPSELLLPLRWVAILFGKVKADLAATTGVHRGEDLLKVLMAGAKVAAVTSVLLEEGVDAARSILREARAWMEDHEYASVRQMIGSLSQANCAEPAAFERAHYIRALKEYGSSS